MNKKTKQTNKYLIFALITAITASVFFLLWQNGKAQTASITEVSDTTKETQEKLEELQRRADIYREIIEIKKKQGETLNNQLSITDSNIDEVQAQMDVTKQQIDDFNSQITRISAQIREKEKIILRQKEVLAELMQSFYEINLVSPVISYLNGSNIAAFIVKKDRISQTGDKVGEMVSLVRDIKIDLEKQNAELDEKKSQFVATNEKLKSQNLKLELTKKQKANLLAQTNGEEARYQQLLARVESQKQELLNIDQLFSSGSFNVGGLSASEYIKKNEPPSSLFASIDWFYSQKDSRWANVNIGTSGTTDMANWGCAVTSVAMVAKYYGDNITPGQLAKKPIYDFDLIKWQMSGWSSAKIELVAKYGSSHTNIDWPVIDANIRAKKPVIVYIGKPNVCGSRKNEQCGGHYVVVHTKDPKTGKYVVHDPYFGSNLYLETSRALVGAMKTNTSTYMDQMIIYN